MAQSIPYNRDFTSADATRLVENARFANDPQYHPCLWTSGQGGVCNAHLQNPEFPDHLRSVHGLVGSDQAKARCCWYNCNIEMKKESLIRHVNERHLELKYPCTSCSEQFTRPYTLQSHIAKKHSGNS